MKMRARLIPALFAMLLAASPALRGGEVLLNKDVMDMLDSGLAQPLVIRKISQSETSFDVTSPALVELRQKKVPDEIIQVMLDSASRGQKEREVRINIQIQNLTSGNPEARQMAYLQLLRLGGPARIRMVEMLTETRSPEMRAAIAEAVGRMGMKDSVQMMFVLMDDADARVRLAAAESIFKLDEERAKELVGRAMRTWWVDRPALPRDGILRLSGNLLREQDAETAARALIEGQFPEEREQAAWYFTRVKSPDARKNLEQALEADTSPTVRLMSARALGRICDQRSLPVLKRTFAADKDNRAAIIEGMECFPEELSVPALITFLGVKDVTEKEEVLVASALQRLTRENFGSNQALWLQWWEKHERAREHKKIMDEIKGGAPGPELKN